MSEFTLKRWNSDAQAPGSKGHFRCDSNLYYSAIFLFSMRESVPHFPKKVGVQEHFYPRFTRQNLPHTSLRIASATKRHLKRKKEGGQRLVTPRLMQLLKPREGSAENALVTGDREGEF